MHDYHVTVVTANQALFPPLSVTYLILLVSARWRRTVCLVVDTKCRLYCLSENRILLCSEITPANVVHRTAV